MFERALQKLLFPWVFFPVFLDAQTYGDLLRLKVHVSEVTWEVI